MLRRIIALVASLLTFASVASADPFPPYWQGGSGPAIHFQPVAWPSSGAWRPYTSGGTEIRDKRDADPSNGGTSPQGYVNVSSGCTDQSAPSIYYAYDSTAQVLFFRWRVQAPPHNYATGPSAGSFSSSSPWQSALWTVMIDLNGDGYRDFAVHLDGSSGSPSASVDRLAAIYSRTLTHSLDYIGDPTNIRLVKHNPTAFVDQATSRILNFQNSLTPTITWPNGAAETNWDYGTTRTTLLNTGCGEYFIDYQIPLAMLDATAVGGPAIAPTTPMSLFFTTSNSLTNPLQKDAVTNGAFVAGTGPLPFGDTIRPSDGAIPQPLVLNTLKVAGCSPTTVSVDVMDARTASGTTVTGVDFAYFLDANGNSLPDDGGSWSSVGAASLTSGTTTWTSSWSTAGLAKGQYLVGAVATDAQSNVTYSYLDSGSLPGASPPNFANATPNPGPVYATFINSCGIAPAALTLAATPSSSTVTAGSSLTVTASYSNTGSGPATNTSMVMTIPAGFTVTDFAGGTWDPGTRTITWPLGSLAAGASSQKAVVMTVDDPYAEVDTTPSFPVQISADGPLTANSTANVGIVTSSPALGVDITVADNTVAAGATVPLRIYYANPTAAPATSTTLTLQIPSGFTFASASDGGTNSSGTVTWNLGTLDGSETGFVDVYVTASSPWNGLLNPASFLATLASPSTASATDTQSIGVNYAGGSTACTTYYFRNQFTSWDGAKLAALTSAPTSGTATTINASATSPSSTYVEFASFFQDPRTLNDVTFSASQALVTTFYISKANGPQLNIRAQVYDYDTVAGTQTLLGSGVFGENGGATNTQFTLSVPLSGTLRKGHALRWVFGASSNSSTTFSFLFDGTSSQTKADYCVDPPATPVLDHDVTPIIGPAGTALQYDTHFSNVGISNMTTSTLAIAIPTGVTVSAAELNGVAVSLPSPVVGGGISTYTFNVNSTGAAAGVVAGGQSGLLRLTGTLAGPGPGSSFITTGTLLSDQTVDISDPAMVRIVEDLPPVPAITVQITASPSTSAAAGDVITVTATIRSVGGARADGVVFDGPIFANGTYVPGSLALGSTSLTDASGDDAGNFSGAANGIHVALGNMDPGDVLVVTWQVRLDGTLPSGPTTINATGGASASNASASNAAYTVGTTATAVMTALISAPETVSMPVATLATPASGNSFDVPAGTPIKVGDVIVVGGTVVTVTDVTGNTVTVSGGPVTAGAGSQILPTVPYVATCSNTGTSVAAGAVLAITIPGGTTIVSSTAGSTGSIEWALGSLAPGATALREVRVSVPAPGDLAASVSCTFTGQATPATDSVTTAAGGVVLSKTTTTAAPVSTATGLEATYTITATNQRSTAATGMVITDLLGSGLSYAGPVSVTGASPSTMPAVGDRELTWSGFSIPASSTVSITFKVAVANLPAGTYQNMAAGTSTNSSVTPYDESGSISEDITINTVIGNDATIGITATANAATVTLTDLDLDTDPNVAETIQVVVTNTATGEQETITLVETGPATGVFTAQLPLVAAPGAGTNNSGSMNALPGQTLSVSHVDSFTSTGSPITVSDTAVLPGSPSAPAITTTPTTLTWTQGDGPTVVDPGLVITPGSSATLASATIQVCTGFVSGQDVLSFTPLHGITGSFNATTGTLTLTGTATVAQYQAVLRTVTYTNTATPPTDANRGVCFQVSDGSLSSQVASRTVNVDPAPTAPAITTTPTTLTYTGGNGAVVVDPGLTVTAGTSPTLASATIQVCTGYVSGEDVLSFTPLHGITGSFNPATGTLTLTGTATVAQYQAVLRTVTYTSTATPPTDANRGVCFQVSDGTRTSQVASRVIDVNPAPQTALRYYLTEGAKNQFLRTTVYIANPTDLAATVTVDFYSGLGERHTLNFSLPATDRRVLRLEDYAQQLTDTAVSTVVTSENSVPLLVEREVEWGQNGYGAHGEQAATQLATRLYFAEGAKDPFSPYLVVLNPGTQDADLTVRFLNADGSAVDSVELVARAGHRETFDLRVIGAQASQAFGMVLESTQPIAAEHAMYMHDTPTWRLGHGGGSTITPRTKWYFSEGTTFLDWDTFLLLANPGTTPATVTVQYHIERGPTVTRTYAVGAGQRFTASVAWEDPLLAYDHFWIEIDSDQPVVAERSVYWTRPWQQWTEGHSSPAMAAPRTEWGFGHGREGLARQNKTYLLFANPNDQPNTVTLRVKTATGERTSTIVIPANDRLSYHVGIENPLTNDLEFWMYLNSESNLPFLVERSLYWSADGMTWTTGTNVTGIPVALPRPPAQSVTQQQ